MIDHQVGLMQFLSSIDPLQLKNNILGHAKTAKAFDVPVFMSTSWPQGRNGPTTPELKAPFPEVDVIDRPIVNVWNDPASKAAVEATGRKLLVISGLATEVCAASPALSALRESYEVYVVIDACADCNPLFTEVTTQRLATADAVTTTWISVLAELAGNAQHIGELLGLRSGQAYAAMNTFLGVATNAADAAAGVGLTGHPPIAAPGV